MAQSFFLLQKPENDIFHNLSGKQVVAVVVPVAVVAGRRIPQPLFDTLLCGERNRLPRANVRFLRRARSTKKGRR